jgi:hypothetical protein
MLPVPDAGTMPQSEPIIAAAFAALFGAPAEVFMWCVVVCAALLLQAAVTATVAMASKRAWMGMVAPSGCVGQPTWTVIAG